MLYRDFETKFPNLTAGLLNAAKNKKLGGAYLLYGDDPAWREAGAMYLAQNKRNYWICVVPATFMSAVSITYFCMAKECLGLVVKLPTAVSYGIGIAAAVLFLNLFLRATKKAA